MLKLSQKLDTLFNMLFVMMEGLEVQARPSMWRKTVILFMIDYLQLFRVLTQVEYGWTDATSGVVEKFDIVWWFTTLVSKIVPRYVFFIGAMFTVSGALLDAFYVAKLFEGGNVQKMWPVKVLRFSVVTMVTTLFSSVTKWLLIPFGCLLIDSYSLSEVIHGEGSECNPWGFPEILATAPTIIVFVFYILFAITASFFNLQTNVLSRTPTSSSTGRVEVTFAMTKILATCLVYLAKYITATAVCSILFMMISTVLYYHCKILPFHHHPTNLLRGAIYGSVCWTCLSGIIVSSNVSQTIQWILLAMVPVAFLGGMGLVHYSRMRIFKQLDRLRGEWEEKQLGLRSDTSADENGIVKLANVDDGATASEGVFSGDGQKQDSKPPASQHHSHRSKPQPMPLHNQMKSAKKAAFDQFFDTAWERKRAFGSGQAALTCARILLYERAKGDIPFLQYVVDRGQAEFPDFERLYFFKVLLMEFVLNKPTEAAAEEKKMKSNKEVLPPDLRYVLYTLERKAAQESAAQNLGKDGQVSAINLMEFNIGFERAKNAHMSAVVEMKAFWHAVARRNNKDQVEEMVKHLETYSRVAAEAKKEYHGLLYKYQQSVELLFSYANFADQVLNNIVDAEAKRAQAGALQSDPTKADDQSEQDDNDKRPTDQKSAVSGASSESKRLQASRSFWAWRHQIMAEELQRLGGLTRKIQVAIFLVIALATTSFCVSDFILFKTMAKKELHMIRKIGDVRTSSVIMAYLARDLLLDAWQGDLAHLQRTREEGIEVSAHFAEEHLHIYEAIDFAHADEYFNKLYMITRVPKANGWRDENHTLWEVGNEYARRCHTSFTLPLEELQDPSYKLHEISEDKRNLPYIFENFYRALVPAVEGLEHVYLEEIHVIRDTTNMLVSINSTLNAVLIAMIAWAFLRGLSTVVHVMEYKRIICLLALALPKPTAKKLYNFYRDTERSLKAMDDEDAEKQEIMNAEAPGQDGEEAKSNGEGQDSASQGGQSPMAGLTRDLLRGRSGEPRPLLGDNFPSPASKNGGTIVLPLTAANLAAYATPKSPNSIIRYVQGNNAKSDEDNPAAKKTGSSSSGAASMPESVEERLKAAADEHGDMAHHESLDKYDSLPKAHSASSLELIERVVSHASISALDSPGTPAPNVSFLGHAGSGGEDSFLEASPAAAMATLKEGDNEMPAASNEEQHEIAVPSPKFHENSSDDDMGTFRLADNPPVLVNNNDDYDDEGAADSAVSEEIGPGLNEQGLVEINVKLEQEIERRVSQPDEDEDGEAQSRGSCQGQVKLDDVNAVALDEGNDTTLFAGVGGSVVLVDHQRRASDVADEEDEDDGSEADDIPTNLGGAKNAVNGDDEISSKPWAITLQLNSGDSSPDGSRSPAGRRSPRSSLKGSFRYLKERKQMKLESALGTIPQEKDGEPWANLGGSLGGSFKSKSSLKGSREGSQSPLTKMIRFSSLRAGKDKDGSAKPQSSIDQPKPAAGGASAPQDNSIDNLISQALEMVTNPEVITSLNFSLKTRRVWYSRSLVYMLSFVVLSVLSIMSTVYPSRTQPELLALAPVINEAGLREELGRAVVFFARELVLDDGLSRHTKQEMSDAISYLIEELRKTDKAVRLGGYHGIEVGADDRNTLHNEIMYGTKCPWNEDEHDCNVPEKPSASNKGLSYLFSTFVDAAENALLKFGLKPVEGDDRKHFTKPHYNYSAAEDAEFEEAHPHAGTYEILQTDEDLRLLQDSFDGHLFKGMRYIEITFDHEMDVLLDEAIHLNEILYSLYIVALIIGFYFGLFQRTVKHAHAEAMHAREVIIQIPVHVLSPSETSFIQHFFCGSGTNEEGEDGGEHMGYASSNKKQPSIASMAAAPQNDDWFARTWSGRTGSGKS